MKAVPLDPGIRDFIAQIEEWERIDSPWLFEEIKEPSRQPVFGKGGKPTGEMKVTGREALQQLEIQMGRSTTPAGANPKGAGKEIPDRADQNQALRRTQQDAVKAITGPLHTVATEMERKWGVGRLQTLVPEEWALKFHTAADKLAKAIDATDMVGIREKAEVMRRGWIKLDELATQAGATPWSSPDVWEVRAPEGAVYAIARTDFDQWNSKQKDGVTMYTLQEVALILEAWDRDIGGMASHKRAFPDSRLSVAKFAKPVPPIEDDDIPF
jgi:hypothetical protein